jgi:transposase
VFFDEAGASLTPIIRRTWAPRGKTPVLHHRFKWKRLSMAAALCYGSHGGGARLAFHAQPVAYATDSLIVVLGELRRFLAGEKATLIWDNLPAHRSRAMRQWIRSQRDWLVVEYLPPYAPDLNPMAGLWANLKAVELAGLAAATLEDLQAVVHRGIDRIRGAWHLPYSFLRHCGLSL